MNSKTGTSLILAAGMGLILLLGAVPGVVAQEAECKAGGLSDPLTPYPSSATQIGSRLFCDSIIDPQDGTPYVGCNLDAGDFIPNPDGITSTGVCSFTDDDNTITVTATLDAAGILRFDAKAGGELIPQINNMFSEGTTGSNYCNYSWPAGTAKGEGIYFQKKGGTISGLRGASFCSGGENLAGVIPKDEEDVENLCKLTDPTDPQTPPDQLPPEKAAAIASLKAGLHGLGYSALLFSTVNPSKVGTCIIDEASGENRKLNACIDRCEPCEGGILGGDPACPHNPALGLDCKVSGNWSCPGTECDDLDADPGLLGQPYCWETVSYRPGEPDWPTWKPPMMRHNWNFQLQATETNPTSGWGSWGGGAWTW
ncbi:hypothetical protein E2F43_12450 [Seongchinamella unica]|uniref:Uncharacterized protein n=1 Tax=Seongchinamella unica TaxID=2547392 RepID=A0A4R5LPP5_9GAMM|nr:hypothetical protein [Seongchinamella unica]TDG12415.1 hypothetical protein E2F43_12450 [Seongchinamella unica]